MARHLVWGMGAGIALVGAARGAAAVAAQCGKLEGAATAACTGGVVSGLVACMALGVATSATVAVREWRGDPVRSRNQRSRADAQKAVSA